MSCYSIYKKIYASFNTKSIIYYNRVYETASVYTFLHFYTNIFIAVCFFPGGKIERRNDSYGKWYREVVEETGVAFVDVHNISADFLDKKFASKNEAKSKSKASKYFNHDHTHTSKIGAQMNARSVAKGLRDIKSELANYLRK